MCHCDPDSLTVPPITFPLVISEGNILQDSLHVCVIPATQNTLALFPARLAYPPVEFLKR